MSCSTRVIPGSKGRIFLKGSRGYAHSWVNLCSLENKSDMQASEAGSGVQLLQPGGPLMGKYGHTRMSSNSVAWSTFTKSLSQVLTSSSVFVGLSSSDFTLAATWNLQYSMTFARIFAETFGRGTVVSSPPVSAQKMAS